MVDREIVQRELNQITTYKEAISLNMHSFLRHLVRGRVGHHLVLEIEREGLSPVQKRYDLTYDAANSQKGIDVNNIEELAKQVYIPQMFLECRQFTVFSYDDRNGLFELEEYIGQPKLAQMLRLNEIIAPNSEKLVRLADDSVFRQECLRYSELYLEVQLGRLRNSIQLERVKIDGDKVRLLTNLGEMYLSEIREKTTP